MAKQIFEMNGKEIFFRINNTKHKIGSKMFPVNQKSKIKMFSTDNTTEIQNDMLAKILEDNKDLFELGKCHRNAHVIVEIGKKLNLNMEFYNGWLFLGDNHPPIHHSFAVLDGNVIDTAFCQAKKNILKELDTYFKGHSVDIKNWRQEWATRLLEFEKSSMAFKNKITFGKVVEELVYIGSPDEYLRANARFKTIIDNFPNHLSYAKEGMSMTDKSLLQKEIEKQRR